MAALGVTGEVLAARLKVTPTTLSRWLNGRVTISLEVVEQVFDALNAEPCLDYKLLHRPKT